MALSPNNEEILVYTKSASGKWSLSQKLLEHDQKVTGLDWFSGPFGDWILSCSSDRNAYVWTFDSLSKSWKPSMALLRFKRAATCAKWSSDGKKFAVGGSEGFVAIGHYDQANDWWVCKHLKSCIDGPVLSIDWHPTGTALAIGTLSGSLHVISVYLPGVDQDKNISIPWIEPTVLSKFDAECFTIQTGKWIHSIAFNKSGDALSWTNHDASISFYYPQSGYQFSLQHLTNCNPIPFRKLLFLTDNVLMAAGDSGIPLILSGGDGKEWSVIQELSSTQSFSQKEEVKKQTDTAKAFGGALAKFQMMDLQGKSSEEASKTIKGARSKSSAHISSISSLTLFDGDSKVATFGLDGRMVIWNVQKFVSQ